MDKKYALPTATKIRIYGEYENYFVAYSYTDIGLSGEIMHKANFEALKRMAQQPEFIGEEDSFVELHARNFLVSRIDYLLIHPQHPNLEAIAQAVGYLEEEYPILDEELYSSMCWDAMCEAWQDMRLKDRIEYCTEAGLSMFSARSEDVPEALEETLKSVYC